MLGNDISLSKVVKYMEGFYFWHAMRLFVCPLREIAHIRLFAIPVYADPRYEACRNWFYGVFNHFRVCWIQCRAVPSSTIYAKARILRFKIGLENRSKISQKQRWQSVQGICMPALYVTHSMRSAKINFTMFLTFFEYAESNAERC